MCKALMFGCEQLLKQIAKGKQKKGDLKDDGVDY